jgi:peptidoglycan/LPS O-acetylase OafA/YrhL
MLSSTRVPALDGVRGVAILLVLVVHFGAPLPPSSLQRAVAWAMSFGHIGVDVFFVLSGYLITTGLLERRGQPNYFRSFYIRRVARIWPLYYLVVAVLLAFGAGAGMGRLEPLLWVHLANWAQVVRPGFSLPDALGPLWSLGIEEQFYLIWPFFVAVLPRKALFVACLLGVVGSVGARLFAEAFGVPGVTIWTLTPFRVDGLAAGAALAIALRTRASETLKYLAPFGLIGSIAALILVGRVFGVYAWVPHTVTIGPALATLAAASLLVTVTMWKLPGRIASFGPLRMYGRLSYAIYLVHLPLLQLLAGLGTLGLVVWWPTCLVIAWLSWTFYEAPCLRLGGYLQHASLGINLARLRQQLRFTS